MTQREKIETLKDTITYLYEKEGRSKSYISRVLYVDRKTLSGIIEEWGLIKADVRYYTPSMQKFLNTHKKDVINMLDSDMPCTDISKQLGVTIYTVKAAIHNDKELEHHYTLERQRADTAAHDRIEALKEKSGLNYDFPDIEGEEWRDILGYDGYQVSNMGRVKHYSKRYKAYHLLTPNSNTVTGRYYVSLQKPNEDGSTTRKNLSLPRVVAHTFVDGYSEENNTVDHINGDVSDNRAVNLEWVSQRENNLRKFGHGEINHCSPYAKHGKFKAIILDDRFEFKTIRALSKFLGISETETRRYLDGEIHTRHTFSFKY